MSRKHYIATAEVLAIERKQATTEAERRAIDNIARGLAAVFKRDNGSFDRQRFYDACGAG